jgi:hypothetical protein
MCAEKKPGRPSSFSSLTICTQFLPPSCDKIEVENVKLFKAIALLHFLLISSMAS